MRKKLALMLATLSAIATIFTGCGGKNVAGNYVAAVKIEDFMEDDDLDSMADMGIDMGDITVDVTLELTDDKKFTLAFDTTNFKEDFSALLDDSMDSIIDASLEQFGMSRDDITDEIAQYSGYDSADAMFDAMKSEIKSEMEDAYDDMDDEIESATVSGTYTVVKDDVVFVTNDDEEGWGLDKGTIGDDGSITVNTEYEDTDFTLVFELQ